MRTISRRKLLSQTLSLAGVATAALPLVGTGLGASGSAPARKLKVVVVGGHPDDPESGCGGTIARYTDLGHAVAIIYLTRGEAGIDGKTHAEAAAIRSAEVLKACEILKARPVFAGQIDGSTEISPARYAEFRKILEAEKPDIVLTHWPVDTHRDHRAASLLVYDAWLRSKPRFVLYYFEVMTGEQTQQFSPSLYVDIAATEGRKRAACFAHVSQNPDEWYAHHDQMNRFRGLECGCKFAEALVRHVQSPGFEGLADT